jgi:hypothetical protein
LSAEAATNIEQVTLLLSSLVGALLVARAVDGEEQSAAMLRAMRKRLKAEFAPAAEPAQKRGEPFASLVRGN